MQINEVKPYVMKPPIPRPERAVSISNSDNLSEGDIGSSSTSQEYLVSRQRLSQVCYKYYGRHFNFSDNLIIYLYI